MTSALTNSSGDEVWQVNYDDLAVYEEIGKIRRERMNIYYTSIYDYKIQMSARNDAQNDYPKYLIISCRNCENAPTYLIPKKNK